MCDLLQVIKTLEADHLRFQVYPGNFGIENALIVKADRECTNGVLHVINHVLHPAKESLDNILRKKGNFRYFKQFERVLLRALKTVLVAQPRVKRRNLFNFKSAQFSKRTSD